MNMSQPSNPPRYQEIEKFVQDCIEPHVAAWDLAKQIPASAIKRIAEMGYLGASIPERFGGLGWSQLDLFRLTERIGAGCSSMRSLLTVHLSLVSETILRWGTEAQRNYWLPDLASGKKIAAFGLSEPEIGSDAASVETVFEETSEGYILTGVKKWTTFGQVADVLLVFANQDHVVSAFLVPTNSKGVTVIPISGVMGTRASMLAEVHFDHCILPKESLLGKKGWGFIQIANTALHNGRFSVASGAVGIIRKALQLSISYAKHRHQFGKPIIEFQLIQQKISQMTAAYSAAELLCQKAAQGRDSGSEDSILHTAVAKYFASKEAVKAAAEVLQIHGANGFHDDHPAQRLYRDAKVLEIIEGSTELQEIMIANLVASDIESFIQPRTIGS